MATLENNVETIPCRHCGSPVRAGMIRCRECRGLLVDTADEFVLSPRVAAAAQPKCAHCGTPLEPGVDHCPHCASALLDDLLKGPAEEIAPPPAAPSPTSWSSNSTVSDSTSELRPRQAGASTSPPGGSWTPLRELSSTNAAADTSNSVPADTNARVRQPEPAAKKSDSARPGPKQQPGQKGAAAKANGSAKNRSSVEDDPPGLFGDDEDVAPAPKPAPSAVAPPPRPVAEDEDDVEPSAGSGVETSAACAALLASLASADATLRVEIATALGKLGDKAAMGPLERHMADQDIRVRRAVATALVQLGHPKGETLQDIAERRPAKVVLTMAKGSPSPKPKRSGGGMAIDGDTAKKLGIAVVAIAIAGGGIWYFMGGGGSSGGRKPRKKTKSAATKKVSAISTPVPFFVRQV